jgi:hypothetical protein
MFDAGPLCPLGKKKKTFYPSANERKYTQIKTLLVGWDKALPFQAIGAANACSVPRQPLLDNCSTLSPR